jgi:hypothetical protein
VQNFAVISGAAAGAMTQVASWARAATTSVDAFCKGSAGPSFQITLKFNRLAFVGKRNVGNYVRGFEVAVYGERQAL